MLIGQNLLVVNPVVVVEMVVQLANQTLVTVVANQKTVAVVQLSQAVVLFVK
jgi:hypothetical protein